MLIIETYQPHPLFCLQNADLDKFQALTFLYLHSNNLTELPHGQSAFTIILIQYIDDDDDDTIYSGKFCMVQKFLLISRIDQQL